MLGADPDVLVHVKSGDLSPVDVVAPGERGEERELRVAGREHDSGLASDLAGCPDHCGGFHRRGATELGFGRVDPDR